MLQFLAAALLLTQNPPDVPARIQDPEVLAKPQTWDIEYLPERTIYLTYLADPRQCKSGSKLQFPIRQQREGDNVKIENTLGGSRALALWTNPDDPNEEMELFIEAAVFSRFDIQEGWDMDAADYKFGFPFYFRRGNVKVKFNIFHVTSHLGDEFISREGRERDSYHNNEAAGGMSWEIDKHWRIYGELGASVYAGPATASGRAQLGVEYVGPQWFRTMHPYAAIDLQTRNEIGWSWNAVAMVGLMAVPKLGGHGFRFTLEYYRGHDQQTQFKSELEHFIAIGMAADF